MFSHFTLQEANAMLPTVIKKFKNIANVKNEAARIQSEMETDPRYMSNFKVYVLKKQELNSAITTHIVKTTNFPGWIGYGPIMACWLFSRSSSHCGASIRSFAGGISFVTRSAGIETMESE